MDASHYEGRRDLYSRLSSEIAQIDNVRLRALLGNGQTQSSWGAHHVLEFGGARVFVKRVPVTDLECENMLSTRNMYDLPTYYNYGLNSAGLGVFRELVTHIKTTDWVLQGVIDTFPLLYHYRVIPFAGVHPEVDKERHAEYVTYWGGNASVGRYMLDRARANHEMLLFLEYIPDTVNAWLPANLDKIRFVLADAHRTITFLRTNGILHMDAHFNNMLTDGERVYLTDFGLALDRHFELSHEEEQFHRENSLYDYGELLWSLQSPLARIYRTLSDDEKRRITEKCRISAEARFDELTPVLLNNIQELVGSGMMKLDADYLTCLTKYRSIITLMSDFFAEMYRNNDKDTPFNNVALRRLLKESGFVSDSD